MNQAHLPRLYSLDDAIRLTQEWLEKSSKKDEPLAGWMRSNAESLSIQAVFANSPYLSRLLIKYPEAAMHANEHGANAACHALLEKIPQTASLGSREELMKELRLIKSKMALMIAMGDMDKTLELEEVTGLLSKLANACLDATLNFLLRQAHKRAEIEWHHETEAFGSGIIILGMGKLGADELNYSSDIDLIILFEKDRLGYKGRHNEQHFMNRLAQDLVQIMQERTADGYVFRTDLRLRPDPASTPPAINTTAAHYYYESVGQNWERAAMIKAKPIAGDIDAGGQFLKNLAPFMWRRSLDFAAIQDIHSIKRQMDSHQNKKVRAQGHNIKLGTGGIREIEFYTQIHQLIWGGRINDLRTRGTCETLQKLTHHQLIEPAKRDTLIDAYRYYRKLEHRIQMVADEQTHSLPAHAPELERIAKFMGFDDVESFTRITEQKLEVVHDIFANSFKSSEKLGDEGNLVFTGVASDPETLQTLRSMGYQQPETISEIIMGWHHGSKRATRTKRARELLTELMPVLLKRLAETASPDHAFLKFNDFLTNLPAGVQLFSLFNINPQLLGLVADIMGSAPTLSEYLSKSPNLLDAVLYADFYNELPSRHQLEEQLKQVMPKEDDFEEAMDALTRFRNEKQFQAGVHLLKQMISAKQAGEFLSDLADLCLGEIYRLALYEFSKSHGELPNSSMVIVALGKLGSREMTFGSDLDLVFVYDAPEQAVSTGGKSLPASVFYSRLTQRVLSALTTIGREGRLYEVDLRLRPSGTQGLLVIGLNGLRQYFAESAWTFELMAFTKSRIVCGASHLGTQVDQVINQALCSPKEQQKLLHDVLDMRARIEKEFPPHSIWDIKYAKGGLIDLDFIAQYLLLRYASDKGAAIRGPADQVLAWLAENRAIPEQTASELEVAYHDLHHLFHMLRLTCHGRFVESEAVGGLKKLLAGCLGLATFEEVAARLVALEEKVKDAYVNQMKP
ncbi:MAG: bifunctional [glutamine synthetase] adenylyltransferase/[glutamine synthetase]-adenylyl-L-tyrosine phosphorylase [Rickettsiales bacterium]|jgi:glutamate-ammonia-ligase adenylyltransferase|nr:bifunctional [glutamine synthetase] adenylyltransferase/[glutamine synthetase]-adenylyl-L-tyrosine phosphorylase [Rickettsiales bacterium]